VTIYCALVRLVLSMAVSAVQGCMLWTVKSTFNVFLYMYPGQTYMYLGRIYMSPAQMYMYPACLQLQVCKM